MQKVISFREQFFVICDVVSMRSKDQSTQIGCVIVNPKTKCIVSTGYNSFPRGMDDDLESRQQRPEKYYYFAHAEENAIINAGLNGVPVIGCEIYLSQWTPCHVCARMIAQSGIKEVYVRDYKDVPDRCIESFLHGMYILNEVGVRVVATCDRYHVNDSIIDYYRGRLNEGVKLGTPSGSEKVDGK